MLRFIARRSKDDLAFCCCGIASSPISLLSNMGKAKSFCATTEERWKDHKRGGRGGERGGEMEREEREVVIIAVLTDQVDGWLRQFLQKSLP
jgi:hypothetical protein